MGLEIRITGSSTLESLSTLAAAAIYCMQIPAVADAAKTMLESADSAMKPGPHSATAPAPVPASGAAPAPGQQVGPGMNPPPAGVAPAASPAPAFTPNQAFSPVQRNAAPGGAAGNPAMREAGQNLTMNPTSPSEQQQYITGMAPPAGNVPGPGAGPLPVSSAPGFTVAQVSRAGADLVTANPAKRAEVNALLQQYGVQTLNELRPEQLGPFAMALRGLGANI